jgi:hypothetical protein
MSLVEFRLLETLGAHELTSSIVYTDLIINFDSFVKDGRHDMLTVCSPSDAYCTIGFGFANLFVSF